MTHRMLIALLVMGFVCLATADDVPKRDPDDQEGRTQVLASLQVPSERLKDYQLWPMITPGSVDTSEGQFFACGISFSDDKPAPFESHGPHWSPAIRVYANRTAKAAIDARGKKFPRGSILVKEKLSNKKIFAITAMIRESDDYDRTDDKNNWQYFYVDRSNEMQFGRIEGCRKCHQKAAQTDFAFLKYSDRPGYSWP